MVDPATIPNAEQHRTNTRSFDHRKTVYGAGSFEVLSTGTAMLKLGVDNTDSKQREEVNISVLLVPGLGHNLLSSSAALS